MAEVKRFVTPKGILEWVTITGEGKENMSGKMQYTANVVLDPKVIPEHAEFIASIDAFWEENKPKGFKGDPKSLGYYLHDVILDAEGKPDLDEKGKKQFNPDGKVYLAIKTGTEYADGKPKVIKTFNSKAKRVELGEVRIGNGSIGEVSGAMGIYTNTDKKTKKVLDAGVTLYLDAIKISKLVKYDGPDSGFGADEDADSEESFSGVEDEFNGTDSAEAGTAKPRL